MKTLTKEELKLARKKYGSDIANLINYYLKVTEYCRTRDNKQNKIEEWEC